jgi:hypothetical protein
MHISRYNILLPIPVRQEFIYGKEEGIAVLRSDILRLGNDPVTDNILILPVIGFDLT